MPKYLLLIFIFCCITACEWEPEEPPQYDHKISGRLLKSCQDPIPIPGATIKLYSNNLKSGVFYGKLNRETSTDSNGHFSFEFRSALWEKGEARNSTYYAELNDSSGHHFMHGIEPGIHDVGDIFIDREHWIKIYVSVIKSSIKPGDTLRLRPGSSHKYFTHGSDTAQYIEFESLGGKHGGIEMDNNGFRTRFQLSHKGREIIGNEFKQAHICDSTFFWQFSVPDSVYN